MWQMIQGGFSLAECYSARFLAMLLIGCAMTQCANPVQPSGGPKDTRPPQLIEERSTTNLQTNFQPRSITLTFDEYIQTNSPAQNVLISPPISPPPEYGIRGKSLIVDFPSPDSLKENTTYLLNFSNAVSDLNEGNQLEDFVFAFSTGEALDSIEWRVKIVDLEGMPVPDISVLLYRDLRDSVVAKGPPDYFSKSGEDGFAEFRYLKAGTYKVFALKDENYTLKYDVPQSMIGFLRAPVTIGPDSLPEKEIEMFVPQPPVRLEESPQWEDNHWTFRFQPRDTHSRVEVLPEEKVLGRRWKDQQLYVWTVPDSGVEYVAQVEYPDGSIRTDTLPPPPVADTVPIGSLEPKLTFIRGTAEIEWNQPVNFPGDSAFLLIDTASNVRPLAVTSHQPLRTRLKWPSSMSSGEAQRVLLLPGAIQSSFGYALSDTLRFNVQMLTEEDLSELELIFESDQKEHLIAFLVKGEQRLHRKKMVMPDTVEWQLRDLMPGTYSVELIVDKNKNGRWDPGDYWENRQREPILDYSLEALRPNWSLSETIQFPTE